VSFHSSVSDILFSDGSLTGRGLVGDEHYELQVNCVFSQISEVTLSAAWPSRSEDDLQDGVCDFISPFMQKNRSSLPFLLYSWMTYDAASYSFTLARQIQEIKRREGRREINKERARDKGKARQRERLRESKTKGRNGLIEFPVTRRCEPSLIGY